MTLLIIASVVGGVWALFAAVNLFSLGTLGVLGPLQNIRGGAAIASLLTLSGLLLSIPFIVILGAI